jgi:hypothetical protein
MRILWLQTQVSFVASLKLNGAVLASAGNTNTFTPCLGYNLPGIIAAVFPSVSDAPIRLQGKAIDHVFESPGEILSSIKSFYVNETLKQVYKIIGSLDFVGNPTIIFSSFVSGVRDLVVAPTTAFLKSPTNVNQVGIGVAKGTISLFSHSASGIFGFAAKMSASAGQAAAILSLDPEYRQWHRDRIVTEATNLNRVWKRRGVQSVSEMVTRPVGDILMGVAMGASGFFISPYKGAIRGGKWGFVQGVATGTAGVVAKPIVGFLDAVTHFSATAHDIAKSVNVLERRYQPALKLRLPYSFGPMSILVPFDLVTARSVYLLRIFSAKSRRNQRRSERFREIHVHSEVLHMEPGVETYAIATTIRVVLIKLKKDNVGVLSPSFAWEVDLSGDAIVSSQVSDHGHNGVALTITKRAEDKKAETVFKEGRNWHMRRDSANNRNPVSRLSHVSSRSDNSAYSDVEEDADEFDNLDSADALLPDVAADDNEVEADNAHHDHGATKTGGKVLEWFTVLAEYQHRRQLTALHNAISCIVRNYDAILVGEDRQLDISTQEGVTTFGIFNFERNMHDTQTAAASNSALVVALDSLPWMHETLFKAVQDVPRDRRRAFIAGVRNDWTFVRDLEASMERGGPAWLVEARAEAMFVSDAQFLNEKHGQTGFVRENTPEGPFSDRARPDTFDHGQIEVNSSIDLNSGSGTNRLDVSEKSRDSLPSVQVPIGSDLASFDANGVLGATDDGSSSEFSQPLEFEDALSYEVDIDAATPDAGSTMMLSSATKTQDAFATGGYNMSHAPSSVAMSQHDLKDKAMRTVVPDHQGVDGIVAVSSNSSTPPAGSRIDRMEHLMEQLVILNATQAQKQHAVPAEIFSDTHSATAEFGIAGVIKNELAELRNQVQARAKEDDALRDEITALRKQLAERRSGRAAAENQPRGSRFTEVFRFGNSTKNEQRDKGIEETTKKAPSLERNAAPPKQSDGVQVRHELSTGQSMARRPSGDTTTQRRAARRYSGDSTVSNLARTPRRQSGEAVRRYSGQSLELSKMPRRSSGHDYE